VFRGTVEYLRTPLSKCAPQSGAVSVAVTQTRSRVLASAASAGAAGGHRVEVRLGPFLALAVGPQRRDGQVAVELLDGVEKHRVVDALGLLFGHLDLDCALPDLHADLSLPRGEKPHDARLPVGQTPGNLPSVF